MQGKKRINETEAFGYSDRALKVYLCIKQPEKETGMQYPRLLPHNWNDCGQLLLAILQAPKSA